MLGEKTNQSVGGGGNEEPSAGMTWLVALHDGLCVGCALALQSLYSLVFDTKMKQNRTCVVFVSTWKEVMDVCMVIMYVCMYEGMSES